MAETELCRHSSLSGCKKRMAEWQPTSAASFLGVRADFVVLLTTGCLSVPRLAVAPPYYLDNDVGCVPSPLALDETSYEAGIKVQLHSQSEPPFLHELGFGVAPGFQTFVSSQEQRVAYDCLGLLHATNDVLLNSYTPIIKFHTFICWSPPPSLRNGSICPTLCGWTSNNICSPSLSSLSSLVIRCQ